MGLSSVNIDALAVVTDIVSRAHDEILADQKLITTTLEGGPVDTSGLSRLTGHATWFHDQGAKLSNQLGYARWLESSTPGIQGTVKFDQAALPNLDYDTAGKLADRARALMDDGPPPPQELLDLMKKYGGDANFALQLMGGYKAEYTYASDDASGYPDLAYVKELGDSKGSEEFLQLYSTIFGSLTSTTDPVPIQQGSDPSEYRAMALLASRDSWDKAWLTQLGNDIITAEKDDSEMWTKHLEETGQMGVYDDIPSVVTPEGIEIKDPMVWLMDALSRNPDAAADLFNGGGDAPIKADGETVDIGANLRYLTLERAWPQDGALSLALGLSAANAAGNDDFAHDYEALQNLDPKEKEHWYSFLGHLGLDVIGLVPELGDWADGLNVAWYLAEGDYAGAATSGAGAIPVFGSSATIAKWIKRINAAGDAAGHVLDAAELKGLIEDIPFTDQDPAKIPGVSTGSGKEVPPGSTFLNDVGDQPWYDAQKGLRKGQTYVLPGGALTFETDGHGKITEIDGDQSALSPAELAWIKKHSARS